MDAMTEVLDRIKIHDVDTHVLEPPDLWTSRLPSKWGDLTPHVVRVDEKDSWFSGDVRIGNAIGGQAQAGWKEPYPRSPQRYEDADPGAWQAEARLAWMDKHGIWSQLLYPNVIAFHTGKLLAMDPQLRLEVVQAYNDFLTEFSAAAPDRLIPLANLPWWDVDLSLAELKRCHDLGHKAMNFGWQFEKFGLPPLRSDHWEPVLKTAEDMGWAVNFHVAFNDTFIDDQGIAAGPSQIDSLDLAKISAEFFLSNARCISELIMGRICERYPTLKFVSVESGVGYIPFLLDALDWQWKNLTSHLEHPEMLLPSEYFRRQIFGTFWFDPRVDVVAELFPDNIMFESDYPHSTSLSPAPNTAAKGPRETIERNLSNLREDVLVKVLQDNAARVYGL